MIRKTRFQAYLLFVLGAIGLACLSAPAFSNPFLDKAGYFSGARSYYKLIGYKPLANGPKASWKPLLEKPVYFPGTKSYYELIDYRPTTGGYGLRWAEAEKIAERRMIGTVHGRLALIKDPQTELFLKVNLRPNGATWFGLSYDCDAGKFTWIDDTPLKKGDYANFDPNNWLRDRIKFCDKLYKQRHWPVFIDMRTDAKWGVKGPLKLFYYFIVEYPTHGRVAGTEDVEAVSVPPATKGKTMPAGEPGATK